jgi:hypothetical protein
VFVLCREGAVDAAKEDVEQQVAVLQQRCDALQAEVGQKEVPHRRLTWECMLLFWSSDSYQDA